MSFLDRYGKNENRYNFTSLKSDFVPCSKLQRHSENGGSDPFIIHVISHRPSYSSPCSCHFVTRIQNRPQHSEHFIGFAIYRAVLPNKLYLTT